MQEYRNVSASVKENETYVNEILPVADSFDIVQRNIVIGGRDAVFYFIDGFTKDEIDGFIFFCHRRGYADECNGILQTVHTLCGG